MFKAKKELVQELAKLAVINGVNVQKGQPLYINAPVEAYELVRECVKIAYEVGAKSVSVNYLDDQKSRLDYEYQDTETLKNVPEWMLNKKQYEIDSNACYLHISGEDPDLLNGIDTNKIMEVSLSKGKALQKYRYYTMNNYGQWSIIAWPNLAWAKKVFPDKDDDEAMEALWNAILSTSRVEENKTLSNWDIHNEEIQKHCKLLNDFNFKTLHFKNSLGTDLNVGLIKNHIWGGGCEEAIGEYKVVFNPNIPTEEVFTMPDRRRIDGKVVSTKPLSYNGNIISRFELTFKDGQIIDVKADDNQKVLEDLIAMDKGTKSLGEVALISYDSPIQNSGILFFDTLFDENASCHLAIGACYPTNLKGGADLSKDELYELGGNDSMEHVDFMFGSSDMSIVGETYDGQFIDIFKNGNFVI